jgi:hypothetical protein
MVRGRGYEQKTVRNNNNMVPLRNSCPSKLTSIYLVLGRVHRLIFWKYKNIKTYLSRPKIPEKYSTPSTGTKCKSIVLHIPFAPR